MVSAKTSRNTTVDTKKDMKPDQCAVILYTSYGQFKKMIEFPNCCW